MIIITNSITRLVFTIGVQFFALRWEPIFAVPSQTVTSKVRVFPRPVSVGFTVHKVVMAHYFSRYFSFAVLLSFHHSPYL
jgi:hypothetical protein